MTSKSKCPDCGDPMEASGGPKEWLCWTIPFTKIEIRVWDWGRQELICVYCITEKAKEPGRDAYAAGQDDGYREGYQDGKAAP